MNTDQFTVFQRIELSESRLSRTRSGCSDTAASTRKKPLLLSGEELATRSAQNAGQLMQLLFELSRNPRPGSATDVARDLMRLESTVHDGLLPAGRYRDWELSYAEDSTDFARKIPASLLPAAMEQFTQELFERWTVLPEEAVETAAWAEWTIQGPLHPYYDGCGRISRALSCWILLWSGLPVPLYTSRGDWFGAALAGLSQFTEYFRGCLTTNPDA